MVFLIESVATTTLLSASVYLFMLVFLLLPEGSRGVLDVLTIHRCRLPAGCRPSSQPQSARCSLDRDGPCIDGHCPYRNVQMLGEKAYWEV